MIRHKAMVLGLGWGLTLLLLTTLSSALQATQPMSALFLPVVHTTPPRYPLTRFAVEPAGDHGEVASIWAFPHLPDTVPGSYYRVVTADLAGRRVDLHPDCYPPLSMYCNPAWYGRLSLDGLAKGTYLITLVAVDALGPLPPQQVEFVYNPAPLVTVHAPQAFDTAEPTVHLHATCTDESGNCASIEAVLWGDTILARAEGNTLTQTISLAAWVGQTLEVEFVGTDPEGRRSNRFGPAPRVSLFVPPAHLRHVEQVPGFIRDVSTSHILYVGNLQADRRTVPSPNLYRHDRSTQQHTPIASHERCDLYSSHVALFREGVLFATCSPALPGQLYEWRAGGRGRSAGYLYVGSPPEG